MTDQNEATPAPAVQGAQRGRRALRLVLPALLIIGWLVAASVGGPYFGRVDEVSSNDNTSYLPAGAEATQVQQRLTDFTGGDTIPAVVVFAADQQLSADRLDRLNDAVKQAAAVEGVSDDFSPVVPSEDKVAAEAFLPINSDADIGETVTAVRAALDKGTPSGIAVHVTGPAGFTSDLTDAFGGIDGLLLGVALGAVLIILVIVYRSLLLPLLVLITSLFALCAALLVVWWLAKAEVLVLTGQTQGILFILVIGAATDYSLLYTARFREELGRRRDKLAATGASLRGTFGPILASGGTVIAGLLCLLLSDLNSNKSLGPVAAIGIVFALLGALTLLPSLLLLFGRAAYWPRAPRATEHDDHRPADVLSSGPYAPIGSAIARRPRTVWIIATLILLAGSAGLTQLRADGVPQSELVLGTSDARDGQQVLAKHFPGGSGTPVYVITARSDLQRTANSLLADDGVDQVAVTATDSPSGTLPVTSDGVTTIPGSTATPTVSDGDVLLQATLADPADSDAAEQTIVALRSVLGGSAEIGGETATAVDTNAASIHDRNLIIPIVLVVIMIILMLLLRSVLAPILLIVSTVLSLGTAMGVSALIFDHVLDLPGADPAVPLYGFVFLVALGVDYNIFLMTRVREESSTHGTRPGIRRGLSITGGVITSAGLVLAATFAALAVIPILFLLQLAVIVAFGVLLDTFLVRTLLVPALTYDIGRRIWWPSALARRG
ncbi:MMPL family transporter [Microlunatus soli]|uniref:Putative drug exporter of the RND superfamily n=1 Tax=Microlunatus soli TaxID=630515 RepID=A0A1H1YX35_9ACTN|nr:MMPL family transporter [Microlunatus soli]SDT26000.1 putative drug exporter of the RND superfamily [Microlunatus soli]